MRGVRRLPPSEDRRQPRGQHRAISNIGQQPRPDVRHDTDPVSGHLDTRASTSSVHLESAFLFIDSESSANSESLTGQALSIIYTPTKRAILKSQG